MDGGEKAVVLLSGGLDSAVTLATARSEGWQCHALTFDYGQRHGVEVSAAAAVAEAQGAQQHLVLHVDLTGIAGSALTGGGEVPAGRDRQAIGSGIPATYVPARNTIFLACALSWAETLGARAVFIGANAVDYSGYPDCRPEFIERFQRLADVATRCGVEGQPIAIRAPLLHLSKADIIRLGHSLGVDLSLTHSCYDPADGLACGECDSCILRRDGFVTAGVDDPTAYRPRP